MRERNGWARSLHDIATGTLANSQQFGRFCLKVLGSPCTVCREVFQNILTKKLVLTEVLDPTADLFVGPRYWAIGDLVERRGFLVACDDGSGGDLTSSVSCVAIG